MPISILDEIKDLTIAYIYKHYKRPERLLIDNKSYHKLLSEMTPQMGLEHQQYSTINALETFVKVQFNSDKKCIIVE